MSPLSETDGSDGFGQVGKVVPGGTGDIDDVLDAVKDGTEQPVGA